MTIHPWLIFITLFLLTTLNGVQTQNIQHVSLTQKVQVKTNKKSPAYLAFRLLQQMTTDKPTDIVCNTSCESTSVQASIDLMSEQDQIAPYQIGKMIWLAKVNIQRDVELSPKIMLATRQHPGKNRFFASMKTGETVNAHGSSRFQLKDLVLDAHSSNAFSNAKTHVNPDVIQGAIVNPLRLHGKIELAGGLAVTDKMNIIVGRHEEGQIQDYGTVDIGSGLYEVQVRKRSGTIIAKLVDENEHLVGEGFYRLNPADLTSYNLVIEPVRSFASNTNARSYTNAIPDPLDKPWGRSNSGKDPLPQNMRRGNDQNPSHNKDTVIAQMNLGSGFKEEQNPLTDDPKSYTRTANLSEPVAHTNQNSFALLRSAAKDYFQTNVIANAKDKIENKLYPQSMIEALRKIVADQRSSDPAFEFLKHSKLEEMTVIYGRVMDEDKPFSGISVSLERYPDLIPIYFNALMLPDATLKTTSANGYFAFLGAPEGMQSLIARRGVSYVSHANVYVESGAVAQAEIQTTLNIAAANVVAFDAFVGTPQFMRVSLQSINQDIETNEEKNNILLPLVNRLSLAHTERTAVYYPSTFVYNDNQGFIHLPLIQTQWLHNIGLQVYEKSGQQVSTNYGFVVGFVQDDDYSVEVMGYKGSRSTQVIYFDSTGAIIDQQYGIAGGGFFIPNFEDESAQIKVAGKNSGMSYLQMIPVDAQMASVLTFKMSEQ